MSTKRFGRAGWSIRVDIEPDYDSRTGEDDVTPGLTYHERNWEAIPDGALGPFPGVSQGDYYYVAADELARLDRAANEKVDRDWLTEFAAEHACGIRSYVGVIVRAYRAGVILGEASLWGVEVGPADSYVGEVADELADEAIYEANGALARLCRGVAA